MLTNSKTGLILYSGSSSQPFNSGANSTLSFAKYNRTGQDNTWSITDTNFTTPGDDSLTFVAHRSSPVDQRYALKIEQNGNATLNGTLTQTSDQRLKENITKIDNSLEKIIKLRGLNTI